MRACAISNHLGYVVFFDLEQKHISISGNERLYKPYFFGVVGVELFLFKDIFGL